MKLTPTLENYIGRVILHAQNLPEDRKLILEEVRKYINEKGGYGEINFICTHNSRRSHLGQIWGQLAAWYYGYDDITTFSGGTEATSFHPNAADALKRAGFIINKITSGENPIYEISPGDPEKKLEAFSKIYDHPKNPSGNFLAIMTCSDADENCPMVIGAEKRISLHYTDPKEADGTPNEQKVYDERCLQIAAEMFYVFL